MGGPTLGNYPDTSLPLSTDTTVTPDAPPTNTVSINVSTSTDFNGTFAGDPTTGAVRVTDAHPAGTYTVTVTAFDSGGATALKTFMLTVTTPVTCNLVGFAPGANYSTGGLYPTSVAVGDFNGDGKQDLAAANFGSGNVSILLGDGIGNFSAATNLVVGDAFAVAVGDFNGDGNQDLAVTSSHFTGPGSVSILLGDCTGNFSAATNFSVGDGPHSVALGDFNGDGKQDLAVVNSFSDNVSILLGDGAGNFGAATNFTAGDFPDSVAVGDFNGDGKQDLAVAISFSYYVSILLGGGKGNFGVPIGFATAENPTSVTVGDFNRDGKQDLAITSPTSDNVSILLRDCPVSQITPAETTCSQFSSGTAETLISGQYDFSDHLMHRVNPRNFLYWVMVTAPAGDNTFEIAQTITTVNFDAFFEEIGNGSNVLHSNCVPLQRAVRQSGDTVTVRFNAPNSGTYFIAIKFNSQSLIGERAPYRGTTIHYEFTTTGVTGSTSGLDLVKYQSN